ncbi:hypothetical protein PPO43_02620 [Saprospira sp. CCB-QB6]|uniref:hypothetical protein n=1 Tax=Saprospira sp. CCB-QB6 TaxID=3023936 RepID=UPI00234AA9C2|nr:hypothetical protein [Saprospira sp. CCB-QB6]WCL81994.1 hypothetical protein PPO43_02620 [Saprospira sp. CCB-QB6]
MNDTLWLFLQNTFDNRTKKNFKLMYLLATDHIDRLRRRALREPRIDPLLQYLIPYYDAYITHYRKRQLDTRNYRINTLTIERLLAELSGSLIRTWDVLIQVQHPITSIEYQALLPRGRAPFQTGAYEMRIDAVFVLADSLQRFSSLSNLEQDVRQFAQQIRDARGAQQGIEEEEDGNGGELERLRIELADAIHYVFAGLLQIYNKSLHIVEELYEMQYLRSTGNSKAVDEALNSLSVNLAPSSRERFLENELEMDQRLVLTNTGGAAVMAYTLANAGDQAQTVHHLQLDESVSLIVPAGHHLLILENPNEFVAEVMIEQYPSA